MEKFSELINHYETIIKDMNDFLSEDVASQKQKLTEGMERTNLWLLQSKKAEAMIADLQMEGGWRLNKKEWVKTIKLKINEIIALSENYSLKMTSLKSSLMSQIDNLKRGKSYVSEKTKISKGQIFKFDI